MKKKTIIITGSTRGIGFGLASEFLRLGHSVVINGRSEDTVKKAVSKLQKINDAIIGVNGSINIQDTHENLVKKAISRFGKIDIWINNAGIPQPYDLFNRIEAKELKNIIDTNIYGLMLGTNIAANFMLQQGFGKIFNMEGFGSDGRILKKLTLYGTTKRAVNYFTKSASKELETSPVQIGILSPGMVRTEFIEKSMDLASPEELKDYMKVYDILAEEVDVVTKFLVKNILKSSKNYDRITFLTKTKTFFKMLKMFVK